MLSSPKTSLPRPLQIFRSLSQSICAARTKYHRLGRVKKYKFTSQGSGDGEVQDQSAG